MVSIKRVAIFTTLVVVLSSSYARAQHENPYQGLRDMNLPTVEDLYIFFLIAPTVYLVGNSTYVFRGYESPGCWKIGGWITGVVTTLGGIISVATADDRHHSPSEKDALQTWGIVSTVIGTLTIGATIWASYQPPYKKWKRLRVSPLVMPDSEGSLALGMGVQFVGW